MSLKICRVSVCTVLLVRYLVVCGPLADHVAPPPLGRLLEYLVIPGDGGELQQLVNMSGVVVPPSTLNTAAVSTV